MRLLQLFTLLALALSLNSCGDDTVELEYPALYTFSDNEETDLKAVSVTNNISSEIDASSYENDADLAIDNGNLSGSSIRFTSDSDVLLLTDGEVDEIATYVRVDNEITITIDLDDDYSTIEGTLIDDEIRLRARSFKFIEAEDPTDFDVDTYFCGQTTEAFNPCDDIDALLAQEGVDNGSTIVYKDYDLIFTLN